jgi:uncharacterized phiE125 gp8 family phage protein
LLAHPRQPVLAMIIFDPKEPGASEVFAFDFTAELGTDTLTGTPTIDADGVTDGAPAIDGNLVKVRLSGGTPGTVATVLCSVPTVAGNLLVQLGVVPIGGTAIDLATAKAAQRIEDDSEDALLAGFLRAAIGAVEARTGKNLTQKVVTQVVNGFPCGSYAGGPAHYGTHAGIRLWKGPVSSILEVAYDDGNGVEQALTSFRLVEGANARLLPAYGEVFPVTAFGPGTVRLSYIAGYEPAELPPELTQAAILLFGHYNANREAVIASDRAAAVELPLGVEMLIAPYCAPGIA